MVTGGAGFIGSHLCKRLLAEGYEVLCVDNFFTGRRRNLHDLLANKNFELLRHDINTPLYVEVDQIYNLACPASPIHYQFDPIQTTKTSVLGSLNMLGLAKRLKARILQASTSEVYGDPDVHPQPESYWGKVNPIGIRACYDEGKRCAETLFFDYQRQAKVDIRIVRIFNTYGPNMNLNDGRVVSNFIVQALKNEDITIYGNGSQTRSFQYVDDLIEGMVKMMNQDRFTGPINLGNPKEFSMKELAETVLTLVPESKSKIVYRELPADDPKQRQPDIALAKKQLSWQPKVDLDQGLKKTIKYFRNELKVARWLFAIITGMIVVLIAGGSGTRLWPLSTPDYPKHLLKIEGDERSLMQHTYDRAKRLTDKIYVVSDSSHIKHVREQLPEVPSNNFIVEPARRGTSSCIMAALSRIEKSGDSDEPIAFIAADHYVRDLDGFAHSFKVAADSSKQQGRITLVGVEPAYPATGFGYIKKKDLLDEQAFVFTVDSFKEKPDHATAQKYLDSGSYLWNCSYFIGSVNTFKKVMQAADPELLQNYQKLNSASAQDYEKVYLGLENISIDYALIEKVPDLLVVPASFDWMDLGSFGDMHKAVGGDAKGNHVKGRVEVEELENSFVQNHEDKPLAVIGLDNVVVINTPDGVLVARKDLAQKVGDVSKRINAAK